MKIIIENQQYLQDLHSYLSEDDFDGVEKYIADPAINLNEASDGENILWLLVDRYFHCENSRYADDDELDTGSTEKRVRYLEIIESLMQSGKVRDTLVAEKTMEQYFHERYSPYFGDDGIFSLLKKYPASNSSSEDEITVTSAEWEEFLSSAKYSTRESLNNSHFMR